MLRLLPVRNPAELLVVPGHFSYPRYERLRDHNGVFAEMFGTRVLPALEVSISGQPAGQTIGEFASGSYFQPIDGITEANFAIRPVGESRQLCRSAAPRSASGGPKPDDS